MEALTLILITLVMTPLIMIAYSNAKAKDLIAYEIKKGKHYSTRGCDLVRLPFKLGLVRGNRLEFTFLFNGGCCYDLEPLGKEKDEINKLYGMSFGFDHHYRSIRIGWRHIGKEEIQLFAYSYNEGKRNITYLYNVKPYTTYTAVIAKGSDQESVIYLYEYGFQTHLGNLLTKVTVKVNSTSDWFKFRLSPYFGGVPTAPNDMMVYIKEK